MPILHGLHSMYISQLTDCVCIYVTVIAIVLYIGVRYMAFDNHICTSIVYLK